MPIRLLLSVGLIVAAVALLLLMLLATDTALSVWQRLGSMPLWVQGAYGAALVSIPSVTLWLFFKWFKPPPDKPTPTAEMPSESSLRDELLSAAGSGVNVDEALAEIQEQS